MELDRFWSIIESIKDEDDRAAALETALGALEPDDIAAFQQRFDELFYSAYDWRLWGAAYIINGGCSDDGFIDFRYGLISRGRDVYEAALANPDSLADADVGPDEVDDELFGYAASKAYENKTGNSIPRSGAGIGDPAGTEWDFDDEDENKAHLPGLTAKFW